MINFFAFSRPAEETKSILSELSACILVYYLRLFGNRRTTEDQKCPQTHAHDPNTCSGHIATGEVPGCRGETRTFVADVYLDPDVYIN